MRRIIDAVLIGWLLMMTGAGWHLLEKIEATTEHHTHQINGLKGAMSSLYQKLEDQSVASKEDRKDIKRALDTLSMAMGSSKTDGADEGQTLFSDRSR